MVEKAITIIKELKEDVILVSGGAAWSDHVAVELFLNKSNVFVKGLELHLPCSFVNSKYLDNGMFDWKSNPGKTSNYYHQKFSVALGDRERSFKELNQVILNDAKVVIHKGFHDRNSLVSKSNYLIAFTWGKKEPEDGGTLDTWNKSNNSVKIHVSLCDM